MEKRLSLAILLSVFVFYFWSIIVSNGKNDKEKIKSIENKEITDLLKSEKDNNSMSFLPQEEMPLNDKEYILENEDLICKFSNIGGNLKNVYLKKHEAFLPIKNIISVEDPSYKVYVLDFISPFEIIFSSIRKVSVVSRIVKSMFSFLGSVDDELWAGDVFDL